MGNRWFLGGGSHSKWAEKTGDEGGELSIVLLLTLHHTEHDAVPLPHALRVRRTDVQLHNLFPSPSTQPTTEETLNL